MLDDEDRVVALPFERFFNLGDPAGPPLPEGAPQRVFEKLDGSLGIAFEYAGRWHVTTRGSFTSAQAQKGAALLDGRTEMLNPDLTYLFEIIYPEGQIVVSYDEERLALLTAFSRVDGAEHLAERERLAETFALCPEHTLDGDPAGLAALRDEDRANKEGYVVRFEGGLRVKIKHPTYVELHRLVSSAGPRWVWARLCAADLAARGLSAKEIEAQGALPREEAETILSGPPLAALAERLPGAALREEVEACAQQLQADFEQAMARVTEAAHRLAVGDPQHDAADRKATALRYQEADADTGLLFRALLHGDDALAPPLWKRLRPSGEAAFEGGL